MSDAKPACFISYTHEGVDRESMSAFETTLKRMAGPNIDFIIDNRLTIGDRISEHERQIDEVNAVIVILTPQYLAKIRSRSNGVYREYKQILTRMARAE